MQWFAVDKRGLGKLLERKGKQFILYELVQNAWDEMTKRVDITLKYLKAGSKIALLEVRDDNPSGFSNLSYAFTLFAESEKKANAEQRGRFNLGEKLVLALCEEATIMSTTGSVIFDKDGRHHSSKKTATGSVFSAKLKLTAAEMEEFESAARRLLPPAGIDTYFNGELIQARPVLSKIEGVTLPTELGDDQGVLRPTARKTNVEIVEPLPDETAMLYEMGIPVVETDGRWHINIGQKVPLNMDRDNVTPSYLGQVRALVAEHMADKLTPEDANSAWVRDAVTRHGETMEAETINRLAELRFGDKRVAYDPTDPEANALAVSRGYQLVHGGSMNKAEWAAVRRVGALLPAGQVTPSPKAFAENAIDNLRMQPEDKYTPAMLSFVEYAKRIGKALMGFEPKVKLANDISWSCLGCYGGRSLTINIAKVGYRWFEGPIARINDLLIHEYGHEYSSNHLSEEYYDALTRLGGDMSQLALEKPELFKR